MSPVKKATKRKPTTKRTKAAPETPAKVLVLRSCKADGSSHGGFKYPLTEGVTVEAPDWNPSPTCGGGLHGLLWGSGDNSLLNWDDDAWWQVFSVDAADVVEIDKAKCKFRRGVQVFIKQGLAPGFALAQAYITVNDPRKSDEHASGNSGSASASGDHGSASASGDSGSASASGYSGSASASGDYGSASASGYSGSASASGDYGRASASGDYGSASASGDYGSASASGNYGSASASGDYGRAVTLGYDGRAMAGPNGYLAITWYDGKRPRLAVGYVGENIEAGKWYRVQDGKLVEVTA